MARHTEIAQNWQRPTRDAAGDELTSGGRTVTCSCGWTSGPRVTQDALKRAMREHRNDAKILAAMGVRA